ncbi:enoyl-CoA hydratase/isomerase family protein [Roseomonas sp. CCTCC AB2023176]|uniref:enoyl-CoA hydratase/isomerase family protein n=1 Tax=Roseomonas sp. CCTCC AB2023176 TaxID=3342640 RepID=UPI0035D7EDC5
MTEEPLTLTRDGSVARITLNRPDSANAVDPAMARALLRVAVECDEDRAVRCVLLTARGKLFCGGGDVRSFAEAGDGLPLLVNELLVPFHGAITRLMRMDKPLVTAIQGPAAGAGFSLAVLGDIALIARSAHLSLAYTALGLSPDGGSTFLLPRLVGLRRAQELALLNTRVGAEEAVALGLATRAVEDAALEDEAVAVARRLAASATGAIGRTRNLLFSSLGNSLEEQLEAEARAITASARGAESRKGIAAFLAKRAPDYGG